MKQDIRPLKAELRGHFKALRAGMPAGRKAELDQKILNRVVNLWQYREARLLLVYVSTPIEVDTRRLIERALRDGKQVAVPRCVPGTREMEFYQIHSLNELSPGTFGVLEPAPVRRALITDFSRSLCIVPALAFDGQGFRLGYGKGYYDRFLARFDGSTVGLCYDACISKRLPAGRFDRPVGLTVTERRTMICSGAGRNKG